MKINKITNIQLAPTVWSGIGLSTEILYVKNSQFFFLVHLSPVVLKDKIFFVQIWMLKCDKHYDKPGNSVDTSLRFSLFPFS